MAPPVLCQVLVRAHVDVFQVVRCAANCEIPESLFHFINGLSNFHYGSLKLFDSVIISIRLVVHTRFSVMHTYFNWACYY